MHIFVINLEKDHERRDSVKRQLDDLQLQFEFIPGILGSSLTPNELVECYDDRKANRNLCMPLVPAHIGCSLSHTKVYREIVSRNISCALILEDDVILPKATPGVISAIEKTINVKRPEVILLSPAKGRQNTRVRMLPGVGHELLDYKDGFFTSSYVVTELAARALLKELYPVGDVADCWSRMHRYKVVDLFIIDPPLIEQDQIAFGSSTTDDTITALRILNLVKERKLIFKMGRAWSKLIDVFYGFYRRHFVPYAGVFKDPTE